MGGSFEAGAKRVIVVRVGVRADDPGHTSGLEAGAVLELVGGGDAGPGLGEGALGVARGGLHRDQVVAVVAVENALVDDIELREPALNLVAVGVADAIDEHVRLNRVPVPNLVLILQVLAHADNGHGDLVA